jgi:hypothetical protein
VGDVRGRLSLSHKGVLSIDFVDAKELTGIRHRLRDEGLSGGKDSAAVDFTEKA